MDNISKVSEITSEDLADYLRLQDLTDDEVNTLDNLLLVAREYVKQYTGRSDAEIDKYPDMIIAIFIMVQDMWDNRTLYVQGTVNPVVDTIINLHQINLL